ncbi:T9SS type A sorting domain-containing protein [Flavobacterium sp. CYK-4]|uniref:DUF7619 domain-containing protein n=1 Tax=Flavobacterium lotistagni TaxID=2709660 RepID=UPI00140D6CB1|nr:T9SS type A sorting domain-containing protein [Flavobacterium lotistagni]NHM07199.1 T9SS type A sorting domain-containing protein [Flavobacterium lotistagni]
MKKIYLLLAVFCFGCQVNAQIVNVPDSHLKHVLYSNINDTNHNNEIDLNEAQALTELNIQTEFVASYEGIQAFSNLEMLYLWNNHQYAHTEVDIRALTNLKNFLYSSGNQTANVQVSGLSNLTHLSIRGAQLTSLDLTGLTSLLSLNLTEGTALTTLDISPVQNLAYLTLLDNPITNINLNGNPNLEHVWISGSLITAVDVSGLPLLTKLNVDDNQITSLNLAGANLLDTFSCSENQLTSLDLSGNPMLWSVDCSKNQLTSLDLSHNTTLSSFSCSENQLSNLDLSHSKFRNIFCTSNNLVTLNLKNNNYDCEVFYNHGQTYGRLEFSGNPNLQYICLDDAEESYVQEKIAQYGYVNCHTNGYCSLNPGGEFYTIGGQVRYDNHTNGCDTNDTLYPHLNLNISNGNTSNNIIADNSGYYTIPIQAGTYTLTPTLENPSYFTITPSSVAVEFPTTPSPLHQNFCIAPSGIHHDADVYIVPVNAARPGFNLKYKIIYKNKGNQPLSGTVSFAYNAAVLDFVSASTTPSSTPMNYINWNFTSLQPFESREILLTFYLNSPAQVPPVNAGFVLIYTLSINTTAVDETPTDNIFVLKQTVVNSFDPNEKLCLEGQLITPEMVGKEVHYMIRFENTGTANATHVVIKDVIDLAKFDISSLVPLSASHSFVTKISRTNLVEFIFENIELPFDDANNDGYVMFKIKTRPDLTLGDSFSNSASIYFDYNAPIHTNPAVTSVHSLANTDFNSEVFSIAPNPATTEIHLTKLSGEFEVRIHSLLGQLVLQKNNANTIDVSDLAVGVYLVTVKKGEQSATQKFIKN